MKQKTVLITGSTGLIGLELCRQFLKEGFKVFGLDQKTTPIKDASFQFLKCDLSKARSINKVVNEIETLDVLIHNAASTDLVFVSLEKMSLEDWNKALAVNLTSCFILVKLLRSLLYKSKGSIINILSTRHLMSEPSTLIYSASKGGLASLTHSLALSLGPEIRVNSISPGWIAAPSEKLKSRDHKQHPVGRVGMPQDVALLALYLCSEKASFITAQDFVVDGGMTKKMIYSD